jgi:hypothetical protein
VAARQSVVLILRLFSNPIEFDGIEIRIIQLFPNADA